MDFQGRGGRVDERKLKFFRNLRGQREIFYINLKVQFLSGKAHWISSNLDFVGFAPKKAIFGLANMLVYLFILKEFVLCIKPPHRKNRIPSKKMIKEIQFKKNYSEVKVYTLHLRVF